MRNAQPMSASLIGQLGSSAFQAVHDWRCRCHSRARASLRNRHQGPSMLGHSVTDVFSAPDQKQAPPHRIKAAKAEHRKQGSAAIAKHAERTPGPRIPLRSDTTGDLPTAPQLSPDLSALMKALELVRQHKFSDATTGGIVRRSGGSETRRVGGSARFRQPCGVRPLQRFHPSQQASVASFLCRFT